ncbi:MAG: hypothetical protein ACP5UV_06215, partial [Thermoplasmata archaeon]
VSSYFSVPLIYVSLYAIGFSSSIPEIIMILSSISKKAYEISWGTLTGSSVYKIGLIMGILMMGGNVSPAGSIYVLIAMAIFSLIFIVYTYVKITKKIMILPILSAIAVAMLAVFL